MVQVRSLLPGDMVTNIANNTESIFIGAQSPHPIYPRLWLVTWWLGKDQWSHDALSPMQEVGDLVQPRDRTTLNQRLRMALLDDRRAFLKLRSK